jgi:hypothetical protein
VSISLCTSLYFAVFFCFLFHYPSE